MIPFEINPSVLGLLDWLSFWIKDHTGRVFDPIVFESYKRIREGYEARQVCVLTAPRVRRFDSNVPR